MGSPKDTLNELNRRVEWTPYYKFWSHAHRIINPIAHKLRPGRNAKESKLWRFNNWVADHYTKWWVKQIFRMDQYGK